MSPSPGIEHARVLQGLCMALRDQMPDGLVAIINLDVDLELAAPDEPGFSRRPDMIVIEKRVGHEASDEGRMVRASEVLVVVEVVAADTRRVDRIDKRRDYADAGIPNYWMVDIDDSFSFTECRLADGYQDQQTATGVFTTDVPFPVEVNLDRLV